MIKNSKERKKEERERKKENGPLHKNTKIIKSLYS